MCYFAELPFYYWRTLRTLRIIYVFRDLQDINIIWKTISNAFFSLTIVGIFIFLILLYLATFSFHDYQHSQAFRACFTETEADRFRLDYESYSSCLEPNKIGNIFCLKETFLCEAWENEVHLDLITFTNIWKTTFILFQVATLEGWSSIAYAFSTFNSSSLQELYFVAVVIIGGFFSLNLIVGIIAVEYERATDKFTLKTTAINRPIYFNTLHRKRDTDLLHQENNNEESADDFNLQTLNDFGTGRRTYDYDSWSYLKNFTKDDRYSNTVLAFIIINTFILCAKTHDQSEGVAEFLRYTETIFVSIFLIEIIIKIVALGNEYFTNVLACFDSLIVVTSFISLYWFQNSFGLTAFRALNLLNLFNYTRYSKMYFNFINALKNSVKQLLTLLLINIVFLVIYASFGMQLYPYEKINDFDNSTIHAPYRTFQNALVHTFQVLSGESWTHIMHKAILETGKYYFDEIYFTSAVIIGKYISLNILLVIGIDIITAVYNYKYTDESQTIYSVQIDLSTDKEENGEIRVSESEAPTHHTVNNDDDDNSSYRTPFLPYHTLFIFSRTNWIRKTAHHVVNLHYFDLFIMITLLVDSVYQLLSYIDVWFIYLISEAIFVGIYSTEMLMKVIDVGFVMHPGSYLKNSWNVIDFIMLWPAFILFFIKYNTSKFDGTLGPLKGLLRSIRTLRLFRFFVLTKKYFPKLQRSCDAIIKSFKWFPFLLTFYSILLLIFSIVGLHLFSSKISICKNWATFNASYCPLANESVDVFSWRYILLQHRITGQQSYEKFHFNNIFQSALTLFALHSGQEWSKIMDFITDFSDRTIINGTSIHIPVTIFFFIYLILFSFMLVKLFTALVITAYCEVRNSKLRENGLDKNQEDCINYVISHNPLKTYIPVSSIGIRRKAWDIVTSSNFQNFITIIIIINGLTFMLNTKYIQTGSLYIIINMIFSLIYIAECVLKITAFKISNFLKSSWNILDLVIALSGLIDLFTCLSEWSGILNGDENIINEIMMVAFDTNLLKTLHLFKFFRFVTHLYVKRILWACKKSFKALPYTLFPIGLLFIVYGTIGKEVKSDNFFIYYGISGSSQTMNTYFNFGSMISTLFLLLRTAIGEHWLWTMNDAAFSRFTAEDINKYLILIFYHIYFISFVFLSSYLFLNLLPAMIIDNFSNLLLDNSVLGEHHLEEFRTNWAEYDPKAMRKIHYKEFFELLKKTPPPLGLGSNCPKESAYKKLMRLNIPIGEDGKVGFKVSLFALIRDSLNISTGNFSISERRKIDNELRKTLKKLWPHVNNAEFNLILPDITDKQLTIGKLYAGLLILDYWRKHHTVSLD
ncbi:voltage-dependent calcium channel type A subunit alpha-1-like [Lycorma delicatula]|uniref:voltage-dependent calcium channel type A subunit alpha-1-like n=1 Tax=Lycorma delicatula TaxID=130591 RepID=UPI003F518060